MKRQIVDMAMNASGIRDTARVLHISPTTVINELKNGARACELIYGRQACMDRSRGFKTTIRNIRGNAHGPEEAVT